MDLDQYRKQIDAIDEQIVRLLNERIQLAVEVGRVKAFAGEPIYQPVREEQVFTKLAERNQGPLGEAGLRAIYRQIISAATALQKPLAVAFLGPEATYTHQAALQNFGQMVNYLPLHTIPDVFSAVERGEADFGVVPIENSTEGAVFHSLDMLAETELKIIAQIYLQIEHCLISRSDLEGIRSVHSKDNALGQCRAWLSRRLPQADLVEVSSTSRAVLDAREDPTVAAIASRVAADLYDVPIVAENIQDNADNITRFLVIGETANARLGEGRDKSSYVFTLRDEVGALIRAQTPFSSRGINLTKIESRPSRRKLWDYYFFIDILGHNEDPAVQAAVDELSKICPMVKWLGSYPNTRP